jgi:methyltransferase-like protein 6
MLLLPSRGQVARSRRMANRDVATRGYSRSAPLATEYYERDYDYDEHLAQVGPLLQAQHEAAMRVPVAQRAVLPPPLPPLLGEDEGAGDANGNAWEVFFREHSTARFFRERRYFPLAFPALNVASSVLEIGAGAGAALLPVLRSNPNANRIVATDVSASSLAQLKRCAQEVIGGKEGEAGDRRRVVVSTAVVDGTAETDAFVASVERQLRRRQQQGDDSILPIKDSFDAVIIAFTLSAVPPGEPMRRMLRNAAACLKPGRGVLCLRDHALGDLVQLRIPPEQVLPGYEHTYVRGDGTMAHFFTVEELEGLAREAGFEVAAAEAAAEEEEEEDDDEAAAATTTIGRARVACVFNRNRRTGQELRRAFVTATFRRR